MSTLTLAPLRCKSIGRRAVHWLLALAGMSAVLGVACTALWRQGGRHGHWQKSVLRILPTGRVSSAWRFPAEELGRGALHWQACHRALGGSQRYGEYWSVINPFTIQSVMCLGLLLIASHSSVARHQTNFNTARIRLLTCAHGHWQLLYRKSFRRKSRALANN